MRDLNLRIALLIEEKPTLPDPLLGDDLIEAFLLGLHGAWMTEIDPEHEGKLRVVPRLFDSDPACTVMLMERLPHVQVRQHQPKFYLTGIKTALHWVCVPDYNDQYVYVSAPTLALAVALAFLKAHEPRPQAAEGASLNPDLTEDR